MMMAKVDSSHFGKTNPSTAGGSLEAEGEGCVAYSMPSISLKIFNYRNTSLNVMPFWKLFLDLRMLRDGKLTHPSAAFVPSSNNQRNGGP